ncbi:MAG: S41 family peptidase [Bacteroidota bacterium]
MMRFLYMFACLQVIIYLIIPSESAGQYYKSEDLLLIEEVEGLIQQHHVDFEELESVVSERIPPLIAEELDTDAKYLTKKELEAIVDMFEGTPVNASTLFDNLENIIERFEMRLSGAYAMLGDFEQMNFFEPDSVTICFAADAYEFAEDATALAERWSRRLKYNVLSKHHGDSTLVGSSPLSINKALNGSLAYEIKAERCKMESLLEDKEEMAKYVLVAALKAYCRSFDPHTSYFPVELAEIFMSALSSEHFSTGITYDLKGNDYVVSAIDPMSDASTFPEINVGDEITGIIFNDELTSLSCLSGGELFLAFYGDGSPELELEIRSVRDKKFRNFTLTKDKVYNEANHIFSFVLEEQGLEIGYIQFPSFYSESLFGGRNSAEDMALALLNLKSKGVHDVIIDLRNNGGGSIKEASELLGYFVDYGPLFTVVTRERPDGVLEKDTKRGKVVTGKVIFLVNGFSASASEIVAATMQKYPNALVVGSSTYGKATGQGIFSLETEGSSASLGGVVVTMLRCYRFDGTHYQGQGVAPDVIIPTIWTNAIGNEAGLPYALEHRAARPFRPLKQRNEPVEELNLRSQARNSLSSIDSLSQALVERLNDEYRVPLSYEDFSLELGGWRTANALDTMNFVIRNFETNEAFEAESTRRRGELTRDAVLYETFRIFDDWISLTTK